MLNLSKVADRCSHRSVTIFLVCPFFCLITLNWCVPSNLDADTIIQTLTSTQRLTLFYWGQDRYINLMPFLFSWVQDPKWNLYAILFCTGISYFLLLELISYQCVLIFTKQEPNRAGALLFCCFVLLSVLVLGKPGLFMFAFAAQPYSLSYLFLGWALLLMLASPTTGWNLVGSAIFIFLSLGLNPSILISGIALTSVIVFLTGRTKLLWMLVLIGGVFLFWSLVLRDTPQGADPYSNFTLQTLIAGIPESLQLFQRATNGLSKLVFVLCIALALEVTQLKRLRAQQYFIVVFFLLFALGWWLLFCANTWVARNLYYYRYFFPSIVIVLGYGSLNFVRLVIGTFGTLLYPLALISFLLICALVIEPPSRLSNYKNYGGRFAEVEQYVQVNDASIVSGGYWDVWPAVFRINLNAFRDQNPRVYGTAFRSGPTRAELDSMVARTIRSGGKPRSVCIAMDQAHCLEQLNRDTSYEWRLISVSNCFENCFLFEVNRPAN